MTTVLPGALPRSLHGHIVVEAIAKGWDELSNGALLKVAESDKGPVGLVGCKNSPPAWVRFVGEYLEEAGFDLLLSTDKNIRYQQSLKGRRIAILILGNSARPTVHQCIDRIIAAVNAAAPGSYAAA